RTLIEDKGSALDGIDGHAFRAEECRTAADSNIRHDGAIAAREIYSGQGSAGVVHHERTTSGRIGRNTRETAEVRAGASRIVAQDSALTGGWIDGENCALQVVGDQQAVVSRVQCQVGGPSECWTGIGGADE